MRRAREYARCMRGAAGAIGLLVLVASPAPATFNDGRTPPPTFEEFVDDPTLADPTPQPLPPPDDPPDAGLARPGVSIAERASDSLTVRWCDNSDEEAGNNLWRGTGAAAFAPGGEDGVRVTDLGAAPGPGPGPENCEEFEDRDLAPDTEYCHQVFPHANQLPPPGGVYTEYADFASSVTCAFTREAAGPRPIWRAQIELRTAQNGTDDPVNVALNFRAPALNSSGPVRRPFGNETWLDHGGDDFEAGATERYDLNLAGVEELGDIAEIRLWKHGDDSWCVRGFSLFVNNDDLPVYGDDFTPGCLLADDDGYFQLPFYIVSHAQLRDRVSWWDYQTPELFECREVVDRLCSGDDAEIMTISRAELTDRIEGIVGDAMRSNPLGWGHPDGPTYVEITPSGEANSVHVHLDLQVDEFTSPEVDVDFDLRFAIACALDDDGNPQGIELAMEARNVDPDADASVLATVLACAVEEECSLEEYIEEEIVRQFGAVSRPLAVKSTQAAAACGVGVVPQVTVDGSANLEISLRPPAPCVSQAFDAFCGAPALVSAVCGGGQDDPFTGIGRIDRCPRLDGGFVTACGNGVVEIGELCDGDFACPSGSPAGAFVRCIECAALDGGACAGVDGPSFGSICAPGELDAALERRLLRRLKQARALIRKAAAGVQGERCQQLARRLLEQSKKVTGARDRLSPACRTAIVQALDTARAALGAPHGTRHRR